MWLLSLTFNKKEDRDIDFFNEIIYEKKDYTIRNLAEDSKLILKKIKELFKILGIFRFLLILFFCLNLRIIYIFVMLIWILITYFRLRTYVKSWDIGVFSIKEKEFEIKEYKTITNLFFIFIPKCASFNIIYAIQYKIKKGEFGGEKFFSKLKQTLIIVMFLGTTIWNLFVFIDILDEIKKTNEKFKKEKFYYKYSRHKQNIKWVMLYKYAPNLQIAKKLRIYKSINGLEFNPLTIEVLEKTSKQQNIVKIWSKGKTKWLYHPGITENSNNEECSNNLQLTKNPIRGALSFELHNSEKKNFIVYNMIQHKKNLELYGTIDISILKNNGLNSIQKLNMVKFCAAIKQLETHKCPRIYELPDGRKLTIEDNNNFVKGIICDQQNETIIKEKMTLSKKQIIFYEKMIYDFNSLTGNDIEIMKAIAE